MAILETSQLTSQVEKLAAVSRDLRRKQKQLQNQVRLVCEERTELSTIVQSQQREIAALQTDTTGRDKCSSCTAAGGDGSDGERPLFSAREMRSILHERNELKQRLERLEGQMSTLQPQHADSSSSSSASGGGAAEEDEAPVQGPLPAEPDDAPWKRQSGIRKFFRKLFTESDISVASFPGRSLSSLASKMAAGAPAAAHTPTTSPRTPRLNA